MFVSEALKTHLETSSTIHLQSLVLAEWNMNMPDNIFKLGNYRYRKFDADEKYNTLPSEFDKFDIGYTSVETSDGGKTYLLKMNTKEYVFTSNTQHKAPYTVILPEVATLSLGLTYTIHNRSIQNINIQSSGLDSIFSMPSNTSAQFIVKAISGTTKDSWNSYFVEYDETFGLSGYYTKANDSDAVVDGGLTDSNVPQVFKSSREKMKMFYSLEDCIKPFRPRSGINKASYFNNRYLANSGASMTQRPRYYMPSRYDQFKYWSSFRTENNIERGIAKNISNGLNYIDDAVPFVVYKEKVPANRLVVKMQTNVGTVNLGSFTTNSGTIADPLFGTSNKTTPVRWKIQYLNEDKWVDAYSFDENSIRDDGAPIIPEDGYVELEYGLNIPEFYKDTFLFAGTLSSESLRPVESLNGYAYLIIEEEGTRGELHIWNGLSDEYDVFIPEYGWILSSGVLNRSTKLITDLTNPESFTNDANNSTTYREFAYISGIRVVVETMNKFDSTFDLIEMSPRLVVNISDKVIEYNVKKVLSDIGTTSMPVGQLLASTGSMSVFDDDQAFNENNESSIISKYIRKNIKFGFYESVLDVDGDEYSVPIKTLYSEGFPQANVTAATVSLELRDFYFFLESMPAPRLLTTQTSLSYAVSLLLDYIGFSNYTFKRIAGESDPIIPYFFVAPDQNVAEVLNQLAVSTQTAMFFDEYNNFVVMSKDYLMPTTQQRTTDFVLSGSNNQTDTGVIENSSSGKLPNILSIASQDKKVYNDGKINYTTRYIQRSYGSIRQSSLVDKEKTWIYKPALLWEVSGTDQTKTINEQASKQGSYVLGAMPLNSEISSEPPRVVNNVVVDNIIDLGENIYWLTRYNGYLYSNGEVIRYDAAEFSVTGIGNVWISSNQEYQRYFASLPFNGKIYPTGLVRIYSTPYYETIDGITRLQNGPVVDHGRGQFGTKVVSHSAGLNSYWTNNDNVRGVNMQTQYLFTTQLDSQVSVPATTVAAAGVSNTVARQSTRNGIIKNFMATTYLTETEVNSLPSTKSGTIQSSALVFNGPSFKTTEKPLNFVSYVNKKLDNAYKHFGTRVRIIGKIENNISRTQSPNGSIPYYQISGSQPDQNINIGGGSGGLAVLLNPETNNGYYFEIIALTEDNIGSYLKLDDNNNAELSINNVVFYKIKKDAANENAIPIKLWGGLSKILVDDGKFTGQQRINSEENSTVYDLSVEYIDIGTTRRFYLYINNQLVKVVDDTDPLPTYNNMALFVRGSSRCMFENVYALSENYSQNTVFTVNQTLGQVFGDNSVDVTESFRKYAMSGIVQSTYLSGISSQQPPKYEIYFEEFGSIMRECAYFDIRYDRAYPALYAKLSPTFNNIKGYTTSGFYADSYGAEFLIFNSTDKALNLDETTGNFLRIQGITFTQDTTHELSVDEFFKKRGNLSDPELVGSTLTYSPLVEKSRYDEIKLSRLTYGKNEFSIDSTYIQTQDDAEAMMNWIINKVMVPKKSVGVNIFSIPTLQLGDIVTLDYKDNSGLDLVTSDSSRFVVYNIEYARSESGPSMTVYLSEV
jgi:hypothetical protein